MFSADSDAVIIKGTYREGLVGAVSVYLSSRSVCWGLQVL